MLQIGLQPLVQLVVGLQGLVHDGVLQLVNRRHGRSVFAAYIDDLEDFIHKLPHGFEEQAPIREVGKLFEHGVKLIPLGGFRYGLDALAVRDVVDECGNFVTDLRKILEGRCAVQQVVWAAQHMHRLDVDEDGAEGKNGPEPSQRMLWCHRHANGSRQEIPGPEVGKVQVIRQGHTCDQGAAPDKLPVLPLALASGHDLALWRLQERGQPIFREVQVYAILPEARPHFEDAEAV
mmetsp:Transcript_97017/g.230830  ORF Transcript_97017/g.230830 Transcript_97017/m.230830 type:complete len:234 (-) Transcript_97017:1003-1704(-)